MNLIKFGTSLSKIQYDIYKYKLDSKISYSKRRLYKYKVDGKVFDLRTEDKYKYLFNVEVDNQEWDKFKEEDWEYHLVSLDLFSLLISHLEGLCKLNKFNEIILPEEIEDYQDNFKTYPNSKIKLKVNWFSDDFIEQGVTPGTLNLAVFVNLLLDETN